MSEICLDCYNKFENTQEKTKKFITSRKPELCEECGQYKRVIIRYRLYYIIADRFREMVKDVRYQLKK